jgi:hypothetical protein
LRGWGEGDLEPPLFQAPDRPALYPLPISLVKIILPQILRGGMAREQMVADRENRVADGKAGTFAAPPGRKPMLLGREILILRPCRPVRGFGQGAAQPRTPFPRLP